MNFAQESTLKLCVKKGINGKTVIDSMFFTPPLKIIQPFYIDSTAHIMLLNVSAGLMKDDKQEIMLNIQRGSKLKITSQSYEKIHNTQEGFASKNMIIHVGYDALLQYMPMPLIPFAHSNFKSKVSIFLQDNSILYYSEILCAGRVARGEIFAFKQLQQTINIYKNDQLIFYDNMNLQPEIMDLKNYCFFSEYTHYLHLIIYNKTLELEKLKEKVMNYPCNIGISMNGDLVIIKALWYGAEELLKILDEIILWHE